MSVLHRSADVSKLAVSHITHCKQVGYFHKLFAWTRQVETQIVYRFNDVIVLSHN